MINRINNNNQQPSGDDGDFEFTEKDIQEIEELLADTAELKKVAARTVLRDCDVARMLLHEAVVMMQVVHRIETFFNDESAK